jgi:hypothetical protein
MENIDMNKVEVQDAEIVETESKKEDNLYTSISVNELTQNKDLASVLHKVLTLCYLSKTVDPKVIAWVKLVETTTKQEFEELTKIQNNFDFQIANRDFRNDEKLKKEYATQESAKMTQKLKSLIEVPVITKQLFQSQINLSDAEFGLLASFFSN